MIQVPLILVLGVAVICSESQWDMRTDACTRKTVCAVLGDLLPIIDVQAYCHS